MQNIWAVVAKESVNCLMSDETQVLDILKETRRNLNAGKSVFGRFELERELGAGGMGVVWLARDNDVEGRVALKFLPGLVRDPVAERDLRDEVRNARDLVHENIVSVRTLHKDDSSIAVEMEFVDGPSVSRLIADSPNCWLDLDRVVPIVRGLCRAIDYAWKPPRRLVHRDVKPLNLLLNSAGVVKVVDFGIAHSVSETVARLTGAASAKKVVGSLPYMSPQQLRGEIHHLNDVYSIGATIYELFTGTPPFRAKDVATLTTQINQERPPTMTERRRQLIAEKNRKVSGDIKVPDNWEQVVAACLSKEAKHRPKDAREIALRLELVREATQAPFASGYGKKRRSRLLPAVAAGVVLAGGGIAAWMTRDRWSSMDRPAPTVRTAPTALPLSSNLGDAGSAGIPKEPPAAGERPSSNEAGSGPAAAQPTKQSSQPVRLAAQSVQLAAPRRDWLLVATEPIRVAVADAAGKTLFEGDLAAGEKRAFPVDSPLLVELRKGSGLSLEVDGKPMLPPVVNSNRWLVQVPAAPNSVPRLSEAPPPPPPFEAEVGPLVKAGKISKVESEWLRAALGGEKGEEERSLVQRLFAKNLPIALPRWRSQTAMEFKPSTRALTSSDATIMLRAVDIVLPPGGATLRMIRIDPGTYRKGATREEVGWRASDSAHASVNITKPFFIGKFEVTQKQYESVMRQNPSYWRGLERAQWPIDQVTWNLLMGPDGFLARLNLELAKLYDGLVVADLPTDDEWEYACRAGTNTAYNNGQDGKNIEADAALNEIAVYNRASGRPEPVGSRSPNAWGLYDMHGNLQEWTQDRYVRGGSWQSKAAGCRSAARVQMSRDAGASNQTGFRLVLRIKDASQVR